MFQFWPFSRPIITVRVTVIIEQDGEYFYAHAPSLSGLHVFGESESEAFENSRAAIIGYLNSLNKHNEPIPIGPDLTIDREIAFPDVPAQMVREINIPWPTQKAYGIR